MYKIEYNRDKATPRERKLVDMLLLSNSWHFHLLWSIGASQAAMHGKEAPTQLREPFDALLQELSTAMPDLEFRLVETSDPGFPLPNIEAFRATMKG